MDDFEEEWVSDGSPSGSPANAIVNRTASGSRHTAHSTPTKLQNSTSSLSQHSVLLEEDYSDDDGAEQEEGGTFHIREDQPLPDVPLGMKPGEIMRKRGATKTFFSPLPLERMFEPPSPPTAAPARAPSPPPKYEYDAGESPESPRSTTPPAPLPKPVFQPIQPSITPRPKPSRLSQSHLPPPPDKENTDEIEHSDIPGLTHFAGRKRSATFQFTFLVPRTPVARNVDPNVSTRISPANPSPNPLAHQTPKTTWRYTNDEDEREEDHGDNEETNEPPGGDPQLKLFRFKYDTYTRDHLGALADSIAIKDGGNESRESGDEEPVWRSTKRIKLSPKDEDVSSRTSSSRDFYQSPWGKVQTRSFFKGSQPIPQITQQYGQPVSPMIVSEEGSTSLDGILFQGSPPKYLQGECLGT